jgi:hypothetical protein
MRLKTLLFLLAVFLGALWCGLQRAFESGGMWWVVHQRQEFFNISIVSNTFYASSWDMLLPESARHVYVLSVGTTFSWPSS